MRWLPGFLYRKAPASPREPSLRELQDRKLEREIAAKAPRWREEARALGLHAAEAKDPIAVLGALNDYHDEHERRPELEKQAIDLGIRTSGRSAASLSWAIYEEKERQRLLREEQAITARAVRSP
jgi:hypothetical protein